MNASYLAVHENMSFKEIILSLLSVLILNPDLIEKISVVAPKDQQLEADMVRNVLVEFLCHS